MEKLQKRKSDPTFDTFVYKYISSHFGQGEDELFGRILLDNECEVNKLLNRVTGRTYLTNTLCDVMGSWMEKRSRTWGELIRSLRENSKDYNAFTKFVETWLAEGRKGIQVFVNL